jgi:poly(3-hydroxybutyrate) depolymerase
MTSAMLASYPEIFAGGAIIAGLPYGTATSVREAFDRMRGQGGPAPTELGALVLAASSHRGPWPKISVWQGDSDTTVSPTNAALIVEQWHVVHGLTTQPSETVKAANSVRRVWRDGEGKDVIEEYRIAGMGHGTPLATSGPDACGVAGPWMLEAGISSTRRIARFWGLAGSGAAEHRSTPNGHVAIERDSSQPTAAPSSTMVHADGEDATPDAARGTNDIGRIIEGALRAAGLMR